MRPVIPDAPDSPVVLRFTAPFEDDAVTLRPAVVSPGDGEDDLHWQDQALCAQVDPEIFFVEKGGSVRPAKRVCMACEVREACLEYALERDERSGVWGGMSERERRRLKQVAA